VETNDSTWMEPVLSVVGHTDEGLFKAINAAQWTVTVVDKPEDLMYLLPLVGFPDVMSLLSSLSRSDGVTAQNMPEVQAVLRGNTWLNRMYINASAETIGVSPVHYAADVLVHEFAHHNGAYTEPPAYAAGHAFAMEMGDPAIARDSDETLKFVQENDLP
jgi:hypothetical protein